MRRLPVLLLLACLPAMLLAGPRSVAPALADDGGAATATAPTKVWNGRDRVKDVKAAIKEWFTADAARRTEIRKFLDDLGTLPLAKVKAQAKAILKEARKAGPTLTKKNTQVFEHGGLKGTVHVLGAKKRKPLLVALHGGGAGAGDGKSALQKWSLAGGDCIVIAPTTPEKTATAWNRQPIEAWVLALIDAAKRTWDVDTNRIYVAGHSMGGYGTWSIGTIHADRFAALSACAGGVFAQRLGNGEVRPADGHIPNLLVCPIWFYNSTDDKQVSYRSSHAADEMLKALRAEGYPYEWKYDEYTSIGHGLPPKGLKPIVDWMTGKTREPHPRYVVWEPARAQKRRFAWIGKARGGARIEGRIDGERIQLSGPGSAGPTTVYLAPGMLDLRKPVTIRIGDRTAYEGIAPCRLSVLLETIAQDEDPRRWYCAAIEVR